MADSTPLSSQSDTEELEEQSVVDFGWAQFVQAILISLAAFFESQQSFISVYTDAEPTWHCTDDKICTSSSNICQIPKSAWAWDGLASKTIVSEWGLECSRAFIRGIPATSHFIGYLLGASFLATLVESCLSRKKLLFLSCLTMSVTTSLTILCNNVWFYSLMRFLCGLGRSSIGTCTIRLLTEKVGGKWHRLAKLMDPFFSLVGILSLPAIAYINQASSWKNIYLWVSISALLYTAILDLFFTESRRWVSLNCSEEEPRAEVNKSLLSTIKDRKLSLYLSAFTLEKLQRTSVLLILSSCTGVLCYGMTLGIRNLGFDIYMSIELNALLYITSFVVAKFLIKRRNWKYSLLLTVVSRLCCFMIAFVGYEREKIQTVLELAYFLSARSAYNMVLIYVIESINVTSLSNSATLMERQAVSFGAVFSSVMIAAGNNNELVTYGLLGFIIGGCGLLAVCWNEKEDAAPCHSVNEFSFC